MSRMILLVLTLSSIQFSFSQQKNDSSLIDIRHRFFQPRDNGDDADIAKVDSFRTLHLMIAGNVYQTEKHIHYAYDEAQNKYDFKHELRYIQPLLNLGDVTIANLKTSFGKNSTDMFSSPDEFALALKYSGINAVMHANIHTANIDKPTLNRTRDLLNSYDINHTGAFNDAMERNGNNPLIINKKGFRIAVLNYTTLASRPAISQTFVINEPDKSAIERDMRMAHANKPDFIVVYFDWGVNKQEIPSFQQMDLVQFAFQQGANFVVGTQPNTPMRIDYMNFYSNGMMKEGIVAYSLGNLIASNEEMRNRNGYIIDMELKKNSFTGATDINDWGVIPVYTYYDTTSVKGKPRVFSVPCSGIENGDILANIPYIEKRRAVNSAYEIRKLLGANADEIQYNMTELAVNNVEETINITKASLNNKFSLKREEDIEPSDAPALAVTSLNSPNSPSLDMLYKETEKPVVTKQVPTAKKNTKLEKAKNNVETVFGVPVIKDTVVAPAPVKPIEIAPQSSASISSNLKTDVSTSMTPITGKDLKITLDTFYRIQFYALKKLIPLDTNYYTHLKGYEVQQEDSLYKYLLGKYSKFEECQSYWKSQIQPRYKQSFIVKYVSGKRILK